MPTATIQVVLDDELEEYLRSLGLLSEFNRGQLACWFCERSVDRPTLHALFPAGGAIKAVCSQPHCVKELLRYRYSRGV